VNTNDSRSICDATPFRYGYYLYRDGKVFSRKSGKFLKGSIRGGYRRVTLYVDGYREVYNVHQLVMRVFGEYLAPSDKHEINHIDGNKTNNCIDNLEWVTRSQNIKHAYDNGLIPDRNLSNNSNSRLSLQDRLKIIELKENGKSTKYLAKMYQVHPTTINRVLTRDKERING